MEVTVSPGQTLADIAMQVYGDLRGAMLIAHENSLSVTDDLSAGTILQCPEHIFDNYIQDYIKTAAVSPATALMQDEDIRISAYTSNFTKEFK